MSALDYEHVSGMNYAREPRYHCTCESCFLGGVRGKDREINEIQDTEKEARRNIWLQLSAEWKTTDLQNQF
jgi:hypothetical protein